MDVFNVPNFNESNRVFFPKGSTTWHVWNKPSGIKFVYFLVVGGGGSGGGGRSAGNNSGGGGGGGGSGGFATILCPAFILPDILYIQPGIGGARADGGTSGNTGNLSYVSFEPNTTASASILIQSGTSPAGGGGVGTNTGTGAGTVGAGSTVWSGNQYLTVLCTGSTTAGAAGALGGTNLPGPGGSIILSKILSGGAGGGGVSAGGTQSEGGAIVGSGFVPTITSGTTSSIASYAGRPGYAQFNLTSESFMDGPLIFTGGSGGASSGNLTIAAGGAGGNGAFGCGGGGGGASYGSTGGAGGKGGDGFILITTM
jgi:hypothetical protein